MTQELPIAECRLDLEDVRRQARRYGRLGRGALEISRRPGALTVRFGPELDTELLRETIEVEGTCCPFFRFEYSAADRLLEIGVDSGEQDPALDALVSALETRGPPAER